MSMPGLWITRGIGLVKFDVALNGKKTVAELEALQSDTRSIQSYRDLRDRHMAPVDATPIAGHIQSDWLNLDDTGWWPHCPVQDIFRETMYQVAARKLASKVWVAADETFKFKPIVSYWLCPGLTNFQVAVCESDDQITLLFMTPPQLGSPERERYEKYQEPASGDDGHAADVSGTTLDFKPYTAQNQDLDLCSQLPKGRRVKIAPIGSSASFYRTVIDCDAGQQKLTLNSPVDATGEAVCWRIGKDDGKSGQTPGFNFEGNLWVICSEAHLSTVDSDPVASADKVGRPGVDVRRLKSTHDRNPPGPAV